MSSNPDLSRFTALRTAGKVRFALFTLLVLALLAFNYLGTPTQILIAAVVGWFEEIGIHQFHDMKISVLIWIALVIPLALLLYRPTSRVSTALAPIILLGPHAVLAFFSGSPLVMPFTIMSLLALLILLFHPAGRSLARFDRVESIDWPVAALYLVGAVPLLVYSGLETAKQLGPVDEHVVFVHFGGMAVGGIFILIMGALAILRKRDWSYATWATGLVAVFIGLVSVRYPASESSLGVTGGFLLLMWGLAFVTVIMLRRRGEPAVGGSIDESAPEST